MRAQAAGNGPGVFLTRTEATGMSNTMELLAYGLQNKTVEAATVAKWLHRKADELKEAAKNDGG